MPAIEISRRLVSAGFLAAALASGCVTTTTPLAPEPAEESPSALVAPEYVPVVRYGLMAATRWWSRRR